MTDLGFGDLKIHTKRKSVNLESKDVKRGQPITFRVSRLLCVVVLDDLSDVDLKGGYSQLRQVISIASCMARKDRAGCVGIQDFGESSRAVESQCVSLSGHIQHYQAGGGSERRGIYFPQYQL